MTASTPPKILFVDDEQSILLACKRLFRKEPFDVRTADSPEEALRLIAEEEHAVIISDQMMPNMQGTQLLEKVRVY